MDCNGNIYNIGMGCCEPVLGPIENYYTKPATDRKIEEAISGISAVTIDEVQEMIDEAVSGITVSGVTEEQMNEAIASAKTEIEGEIPIVPTKVSAFENDVPYLTEHQSLSGYATEQWVEDKHYITGVDLSDYALKSEIPVVPTSNTAFTNDAGYITGVDLSNYATMDNLTAATDDMATKTWVGQQGYLTEHQSLTAYSTTEQVNSAITQAVSGKADSSAVTQEISAAVSGKTDTSAFTAHTSDTSVHVTSAEKSTWSSKANVWCGSEADWALISGGTLDPQCIYLVY